MNNGNNISDKNLETIEVKDKRKTFAKIGYTRAETQELVDALNKLIANYSVHYQKLRNFHWNVKGRDFFDIHEKTEQQYNYAKEAVDGLAERIRVFGQTPYSNMSDYLKHSEVKESSTDLSAIEMVKEILKDQRVLLEYMFNAIEVAIEHGDSATEDMVKSFIKQTEEDHWMWTAFSYED